MNIVEGDDSSSLFVLPAQGVRTEIKMSERISVVIPFYTGKEWLKEAIDSVLNQTLSPDEIIVVNDGSPENIDDLVTAYKNKVEFIFQENKGAASARNRGIRSAKGEYIAFLDSDDIWLRNKLEIQLRYMEENGLYWSHCPYKVFDDKSKKIIKEIDNRDSVGMIFPRSLARCTIATPCVMVKKECLKDRKMMFNEKMRHGQDYCLWNILAKKYIAGNVGEPLVLVRNHTTNVAKNVVSQIKSKSQMYDFIKKHENYFGSIPLLLKVAFLLSKFGYNLVDRVKIMKLKYMLSYLLYAVPWGLFRFFYYFENKRVKNTMCMVK